MKLAHNYHELEKAEKYRYYFWDRHFFSREKRFFFEGCRALPGQMYIADRKGLYDAVIKYKPKYCFEVGTHTGGGSTYFLASAFAELGQGKVVTLESDRSFWEYAKDSYQKALPHLAPYVEFVHGDDVKCFEPYLRETGGLECAFLDGSENAEQTLEQYEFFKKFLKPGSVLMAHDWDTDKMRLLRPLLEQSKEWEFKMLLGQPESVGFAVLEHRS
ncbi:MAG: class I SAM-dependent methyltransferase [Bdellovibrionia bacterium]